MMKFDEDMKFDEGEDCVVKLRGLPWSATEDDILEFFSDCRVHGGRDGIHLVVNNGGKASGEAFVEVASGEDVTNFTRKDKKSMGHRYIEVFKVKKAEMDWSVRRSRPAASSNGNNRGGSGYNDRNRGDDCDAFLRLRGLPFECSKEDIQHFFQGLEIVSNGIQLMVDTMGRSSGEAYVQFSTKDEADKALEQDRQCIGHRYIETFRVGPAEMRSIQMLARPAGRSYNTRPSPYDRGGGGRQNMDRGPSRYGSGSGGGGGRPARYFSKGFEDDWCFPNESNNWNSRPPPPPLMLGPRRGGSGRGGGGRGSRHSDSSGGKNCVLMRGLPFKAGEGEIRKFFEPLVPTCVDIIYESSGRPSGTAKVQFSGGDDVTRAMAKHKERMEHRYIELFVHSMS